MIPINHSELLEKINQYPELMLPKDISVVSNYVCDDKNGKFSHDFMACFESNSILANAMNKKDCFDIKYKFCYDKQADKCNKSFFNLYIEE